MKKLLIYSTIVFVFCITDLTYSNGFNQIYGKKIVGLIRPYGGLGATSVDISGDTFNYRSGIQAFYSMGKEHANLGVGLDVGYIHLYKTSSDISANYLNSLLITEFTVIIVTLQFGIGSYFGVGDVNETKFGLMFAGGLNIPAVANYISIPLLVRSDVIFTNKTPVPISFFTGITFYLAD